MSLTVTTSQTVSRAADTTSASVQNACADHCLANGFMTKEFLYCADVIACFAVS